MTTRSQKSVRALLLVPLLVAGACGPRAGGGGAASTAPVRTATAGGARPAVAPPVGPADTALPAGAPLTARLAVARAEPLLAAFLAASPDGQQVRGVLEHVTAQPPGSLANGRIAAALGLDPARAIEFGLAPVGASSRDAIERLRALAREVEAGQGGDLTARIRRAYGNEGVALWARLVVPSRDVGATKSALGMLLDTALTAVEPPPGVERLYLAPDAGFAVSLVRAADAVVLEVLYTAGAPGSFEDFARATLGALRARREPPGGAVLAPASGAAGASATTPSPSSSVASGEASVASLVFDPAALAAPAFAVGVGSVVRAVAMPGLGGGATADTLAAEGLREAGRVFALAGDAQGAPYFTRAELALGGAPGALEVRGRALLGATQPPAAPDAALWAPSPAVDVANAMALAEIALPWGAAWTLPTEPAGAWLDRPRPFQRALRDAGFGGFLVALPHALALAAQDIARDALPRDVPVRNAALPRVERAGVFRLATANNPSLSYMLLTPSTTAAQAACVLAPPGPRGCTTQNRLRPNGPPVAIDGNGRFARLVTAGNRLVLLTSHEAGALGLLAPNAVTASQRPHAAFHLELDRTALMRDAELRPFAALLGPRYTLDASRDGQAIAFDAHPVQ